MRFKKLKWEEMTIEEKVSNIKNRIWKFFKDYPEIKNLKDERIFKNEYRQLPEMQGYKCQQEDLFS